MDCRGPCACPFGATPVTVRLATPLELLPFWKPHSGPSTCHLLQAWEELAATQLWCPGLLDPAGPHRPSKERATTELLGLPELSVSYKTLPGCLLHVPLL